MEELINQFKLPSYIKNKSFSEASKLIQDKFKDRHDKVSQDTLKSLLGRLREAQEFIKGQSESPEYEQQEQSQTQGSEQEIEGQPGQEQIPQGDQQQMMPQNQSQPGMTGQDSQQQFGMGGGMFSQNKNNYIYGNQAETSNVNIIAGQGSGENSVVNSTKDGVASAVGPFGVLFRGIQKGGQKGGEAIGGEFGAGMSDIFSPEESTMEVYKDPDSTPLDKLAQWVPGLGGVVAYKNRQKKQNKADTQAEHALFNSQMNIYAKGGYTNINKYSGKDHVPSPYMTSKLGGVAPIDYSNLLRPWAYGIDSPKMKGVNTKPLSFTPATLPTYNDPDKYKFTIKGDLSKFDNVKTDGSSSADGNYKNDRGFKDTKVGASLSKVGNTISKNKDLLRYAPIAMNAYQLSKLKKPEVERLNRLGNRYKEQYVDERRLMNAINEGYGIGAALEGSGGSLGRYSTLSRANQLAKTKAISDAYSKAADVNRNENRIGQNFNKATDTFNIRQSNREKDINARNRGNYDSQKSKLQSQLGTDIGQIGKEYLYKDQAEKIFGYDWRGKYIKENPNATEEEINYAQAKAIAKLKANKKNKKDE